MHLRDEPGTSFLIIAVDNAMIIAMNVVLQRYGGAGQGDLLITVVTIAQSFMLVVTMPLGGISGGTQSIRGFNYGARKVDRVMSAQRRSFAWCLAHTALMVLARFRTAVRASVCIGRGRGGKISASHSHLYAGAGPAGTAV